MIQLGLPPLNVSLYFSFTYKTIGLVNYFLVIVKLDTFLYFKQKFMK